MLVSIYEHRCFSAKNYKKCIKTLNTFLFYRHSMIKTNSKYVCQPMNGVHKVVLWLNMAPTIFSHISTKAFSVHSIVIDSVTFLCIIFQFVSHVKNSFRTKDLKLLLDTCLRNKYSIFSMQRGFLCINKVINLTHPNI